MRKLKLFLSMLMLIAFSVGNVWATEYTHTFATSTQSISGDVCTVTVADGHPLSIIAEKNGGSNFASYAPFRLYNKNKMTISANSGYVITQVDISFSSAQNLTVATDAVDYSYESYSFVPKDGEGNAASCSTVSFTNGNSSQARIASVTITYQESGSTPTCATPTFSPAAGSYEGTQNVTISSTTGATIYYTTDGTTPSTTSSVYSTPIAVAADMTIKAYAVKTDYNDSEVATAAYEITEGPDETIAFEGNTDWDIPAGSSSKTVDEGTYTDGTYTIKIAGSTGEGYYINGYLLLGKTGAYVELPEFSNPVEKIVVVGTSGGSTGVKFNIYDGTTAVSTEVTGCKNVSQEFTIENPEANKAYKVQVTSNANLQISAIKIYFGAAATVNKPTISGDESFVTSTSVSMSCTTTGAEIYYTLDGSDPQISGSKQLYSDPFSLTVSGSVNARAKLGDDWSGMVSKTFTKVTALSTMAEVQAAATTTTDQPINVAISNWVVTAVSGGQAWIADADNAKGILLYKSGHGFEAGKKINGTVVGTKIKLYNLFPELTSLLASEVTVTDAEAVSPRSVTIPTLISNHPAEQGTLVKLDNVTYTSSMLSDGVNSIAADNKFFSSLALVEGTTYNITGVVTYYKNGDDAVVKIAPRSAADVEAQTPVVTPTAANLAALKAAARGTYILTLENAVVTYVNGKNAFIEDATGGALIFIQDHGFTAGDCLNGDYQVVTTDYQGKFEITAIEPQAGAATTTAAIPLTTVSIATLNADFAAYESKRIKIAGANVTDAISGSDRNGAINDGAALAVYAAVASTITLTADDNVDIIGYPGFHNTDQQLNVWRQEDITVNVKEDPELAYNPAVVNVLLSDLASFTPADLEYATGFDGLAAITYESSDPSIATVETDGTVTLVATEEGSTTITASFPGNAKYKVDHASYTINVSATPITPVYTMSFDMTRASYDAAADAQVVWNSSVVTMTADKNDGTKVTNFLAGNYSGTTLIEETRFYAKNSISFVPQAGVTITKIEWMSTAKGYATKLAAETFVNATAVVDGTDDKLVIITPSAAGEISVTLTDAARATAVTVYYEAESEKAKLDASISIANINTAVGEEDILLSSIAATSNPNKKAISYAITSGTAVSIVGEGKDAAFHAVEEGSATITATIPNDFGNYTGATTTFNIVVAAAPASLVSIAISGDASVLEYTEGQDFNPAGLVVTGTYSDASTAPISDGITWAFDPSPLTVGTTSVSVTATVSEITSDAFVVNGLTVDAAPAPTTDNVVILATYGAKLYAMSTTLSSSAFTAIEVEEDGSNIVVPNADAKAAIQWTRTSNGVTATFQDAEDKYLAHTGTGTNLMLADDAENWTWDATNGYYYAVEGRTFFYYKDGIFKNYSVSNLPSDKTDYSGASEVRVIDPANIVITSKVSAELAYDPATLTITQGDAWSAPTLNNPYSVTITSYATDNDAVATVSDAGVIALAGGIGTAHITAHFDGDASYLDGDAVYTITVNEAGDDLSGTWTRVTSVAAGQKIIIAGTYNAKTMAMGKQNSNNRAAVLSTLDGDVLTPGAATKVFTLVDAGDGLFAIQASNGKYLNAAGTGSSNYLKEADDYVAASAKWTISFDENGANIVATSTGNRNVIRYNSSSGSELFSCYAAGGQRAINIYSTTTTPTPVYETVRTGLTAGNYFTVCYDKTMTAIKGATLWEFVGKDADFAYIQQVDAPYPAGTPYIIYAESDGKLEAVVEEVASPAAGSNKGLHGTFSLMEQGDLDAAATAAGYDLYLVIGNQLRRATGYALDGITPLTGNSLPKNRAYVILEDIPNPPASMPAHVRRMPMQTDQAQGFENIEASEKPMKLMIDGQMYILRGEKVYDATGRLVK